MWFKHLFKKKRCQEKHKGSSNSCRNKQNNNSTNNLKLCNEDAISRSVKERQKDKSETCTGANCIISLVKLSEENKHKSKSTKQSAKNKNSVNKTNNNNGIEYFVTSKTSSKTKGVNQRDKSVEFKKNKGKNVETITNKIDQYKPTLKLCTCAVSSYSPSSFNSNKKYCYKPKIIKRRVKDSEKKDKIVQPIERPTKKNKTCLCSDLLSSITDSSECNQQLNGKVPQKNSNIPLKQEKMVSVDRIDAKIVNQKCIQQCQKPKTRRAQPITFRPNRSPVYQNKKSKNYCASLLNRTCTSAKSISFSDEDSTAEDCAVRLEDCTPANNERTKKKINKSIPPSCECNKGHQNKCTINDHCSDYVYTDFSWSIDAGEVVRGGKIVKDRSCKSCVLQTVTSCTLPKNSKRLNVEPTKRLNKHTVDPQRKDRCCDPMSQNLSNRRSASSIRSCSYCSKVASRKCVKAVSDKTKKVYGKRIRHETRDRCYCNRRQLDRSWNGVYSSESCCRNDIDSIMSEITNCTSETTSNVSVPSILKFFRYKSGFYTELNKVNHKPTQSSSRSKSARYCPKKYSNTPRSRQRKLYGGTHYTKRPVKKKRNVCTDCKNLHCPLSTCKLSSLASVCVGSSISNIKHYSKNTSYQKCSVKKSGKNKKRAKPKNCYKVGTSLGTQCRCVCRN